MPSRRSGTNLGSAFGLGTRLGIRKERGGAVRRATKSESKVIVAVYIRQSSCMTRYFKLFSKPTEQLHVCMGGDYIARVFNSKSL